MIELDEWTPRLDADGEQIPITYTFSATDEQEEGVSEEVNIASDRPLASAEIKRRAQQLARRVKRDHPKESPWAMWKIEVNEEGEYYEPSQVCCFLFIELE